MHTCVCVLYAFVPQTTGGLWDSLSPPPSRPACMHLKRFTSHRKVFPPPPQIVRIKSFSSNTAGDVQAAVDRFKAKGMSRIVVDLRGNVGGLLPAGIDTAGLFLDSGKVRGAVVRYSMRRDVIVVLFVLYVLYHPPAFLTSM